MTSSDHARCYACVHSKSAALQGLARLGHGDDVGHDALVLKAPVVRAGAPEARLHLVRDAHAARVPHHLQVQVMFELRFTTLSRLSFIKARTRLRPHREEDYDSWRPAALLTACCCSRCLAGLSQTHHTLDMPAARSTLQGAPGTRRAGTETLLGPGGARLVHSGQVAVRQRHAAAHAPDLKPY